MPRFGNRSKKNLETCHEDLQKILNKAIEYVDFGVIEGHRTKETQNHYYETGRSTLKFPQSKHNTNPSLAVDIVPYLSSKGYDWNDVDRFHNIVYFIKGIAYSMGIEVILGCDWDSDFYTKDHRFHDAPHIQLNKRLDNGHWVQY